MSHALLLDLDDTLVPEEAFAVSAFRSTAALAAERHPAVDAGELAAAARIRARELWYASPSHPYAKRVGISSWEGLWCGFEGEHDDLSWLRRWAPSYRRDAWARALADQGVEDRELAAELGERFGAERRQLRKPYPDAAPALDELARSHPLALITNGASCLQREKLAGTGLADRFGAVVVSADLESAKPDPAVFTTAAESLGCDPSDAVMIGNSLEKDVAGALGAGLAGAIWVNRDGLDGSGLPEGVPEIATLAELADALQGIS